ncbi:MAG: hypothetical protein V4632_07700 [Pseudomonadota bacterium]
METSGKPFQVKTKRPVKEDVVPRLPHERDESDDSQASGPREDMKQAYKDISEGQVDTDVRRGGGVEDVVQDTSGKPARTPAGAPSGPPKKRADKM